MASEKPLRRFTGAFQALAQTVGPNSPMTIKAFTDACSELTSLIHLMGDDSSFWFDEYAPKVEQIKTMSTRAGTLEELIDQDMASKHVTAADSNTRILLRLRRALEVVKVLGEQLLKGRDISFQSAAQKGYKLVFARHHDQTTQKIVIAATSALPTRATLLSKMEEEDEDDAIVEIQKYVDASAVVIDYIDGLFKSRGLKTDW